MADDFGYLNARVRSRRSQLLPEPFFIAGLELGFPEFVLALTDTPYGADLKGESLADLDAAVSAQLTRSLGDLPRLVSGEARTAVQLLLMRADLSNFKMILRAKAAGLSAEEIAGKLMPGTLPEAIYPILVESPDTAGMAQVLVLSQHPLASALREAMSEARTPLELEIALDRNFQHRLLRQSRRLDQPFLSGFLAFEVDALNLGTAMRLAWLRVAGSREPYFVAGGLKVNFELFSRLAEKEESALEELAGGPFAALISAGDLRAMERRLRCILLKRAHQGVLDVLGIGLVIDYVWRKNWEAARLRLLARRARFAAVVAEREVICT